jgi:hypothetical protein
MKALLNTALILFCITLANAQDRGFQLALTPELQWHSTDKVIHGLTLNFVGQNEQHGLTFGVGNIMTGESTGFSLGLVNSVESYRGAQLGVVNAASENYTGFMLGVVNTVGDSFTGMQLGCVNYARNAHGFQLGVINYADDLRGLQIGAINFVAKNAWFGELPNRFAPCFPIVNWSF